MGTVGTTSKVGKNWTSLSPIIVQQLEDLFPQIILRNEMTFLYQLDAVETNMEMFKDKQVQVMDGGDKLH